MGEFYTFGLHQDYEGFWVSASIDKVLLGAEEARAVAEVLLTLADQVDRNNCAHSVRN